jgi:hypothetical protein
MNLLMRLYTYRNKIKHSNEPKTVFGFLTVALRKRTSKYLLVIGLYYPTPSRAFDPISIQTLYTKYAELVEPYTIAKRQGYTF